MNMHLHRLFLSLLVIAFVFTACETPVQPQEVQQPQEETNKKPDLTPEEVNNKRKVDLAAKDQKLNLTSNYSYIISARDLSIFSDLLKRSSFAKMSHNENTTIFAPSNKAFTENKDFTQGLKTGTQQEIDDFLGKHIVKSDESFKQMFIDKKVNSISGKEIRLSSDEEGMKVNGKPADGNFISTGTGSVFYLEILSI